MLAERNEFMEKFYDDLLTSYQEDQGKLEKVKLVLTRVQNLVT
jgi:hypothetical protein